MILFFLVITHHFPQTFRVIHLTIPLVLATGLLATVKQRVDPLQYTFASIVDSLPLKDIQPEHAYAYLMEAGLEVFPSAIAIATMTLSLKMLLITTILVSQMLPAR